VKTQCVFKSVFIFPINLRIARKYFGDVTYLRTIFQIEDSFVFLAPLCSQ